MIRRGREADKKLIFDMYAKSGVLNFEEQEDYFVNSFKAENVIVNEVNGHVAASIQVDSGAIYLHGKLISIGLPHAMIYDRSKGTKWIDSLKSEAFGQQEYKNLVTIIPTNNPSEFYRYGFEEIYHQRLYSINRNDLDNASFHGVNKNFTIDELYSIYQSFIANFDGYPLRNRAYYSDLISLIQKKKYNLAVYHDEDGKALGYMIYRIEASKVVVKEIMYLNGLSLLRLLCYGLRLKNNIQVFVSENEDFTKAFPKLKYKLITNAVAKINDYELFNKLFGSNATNISEAFNLKENALYYNDLNY